MEKKKTNRHKVHPMSRTGSSLPSADVRRDGDVVCGRPAPVPVQNGRGGGPAGPERPGATRVRPSHERRVDARVVEPVGDEPQVAPGVGRQLAAARRGRRPVGHGGRGGHGVHGHQVGPDDAIRGGRAAPVAAAAAVRLAFGRRRLALGHVVVAVRPGEVGDRGRGGRGGRRRRVVPVVADRQVRLADVHHRVVHRPRLEERVPHELEERYDDEREHALEERERLAEPLERLGRRRRGRGRLVAVRVEHRLPLAGVLGGGRRDRRSGDRRCGRWCGRRAGRRCDHEGGRRGGRGRGRRSRRTQAAGHVHAVRLPSVTTGRAVVAHHAGASSVRLRLKNGRNRRTVITLRRRSRKFNGVTRKLGPLPVKTYFR